MVKRRDRKESKVVATCTLPVIRAIPPLKSLDDLYEDLYDILCHINSDLILPDLDEDEFPQMVWRIDAL